jgi:hypothetical protein
MHGILGSNGTLGLCMTILKQSATKWSEKVSVFFKKGHLVHIENKNSSEGYKSQKIVKLIGRNGRAPFRKACQDAPTSRYSCGACTRPCDMNLPTRPHLPTINKQEPT